MLQAIKDFIKAASEQGLRLPFVYDAQHNKPSITLLFAYITFVVALVSTIVLHFTNVLTATITAIIFWVIASVFYLMGDIRSFKADLDDRSIELEGENEEDDKPKQ